MAVTGVVVGICAVAVVAAVVRLSFLPLQQRSLDWETLVRRAVNAGSRSFVCLSVRRPKICCHSDREGGRL